MEFVLSDILGDEDHLGDMDFKVTGTADGITACQNGYQIQGLTMDIMETTSNQSKRGGTYFRRILKTIDKPRADVKPRPKMEILEIPKDFIGAVVDLVVKLSNSSTNLLIDREIRIEI